MKKTILPCLALPLVLLAPLSGFRTPSPAASLTHTLAAEGREVRQVAAFTRLSLATSVEVILTQGSTQKVELEGNAEDLKEIETTVKDGRLRIGTPEGRWKMGRTFKGPVKAYVTMPQIQGLSVSGSGSMHADQPIRTNGLDLSVSGSGQLRAPITADNVEASVSGSGIMKLSGSGKVATVSISGSGRIEASDLQVQDAKVQISGSGNCRMNVAQTLDARISGSGSVYYAGAPRITSKISGSGRVLKS